VSFEKQRDEGMMELSWHLYRHRRCSNSGVLFSPQKEKLDGWVWLVLGHVNDERGNRMAL
jgi:hypothetical protein